MRVLFITLLGFLLGFSTTAQNDELEFFKSTYQLEKKALLMDFLELNEEESKAFWPIYEEYQTKLSENGSKRIELLSNYAEGYGDFSEEEVAELATESFALRAEREKLQKTYYKKFKKELSATRAAQFVQFERFIETAINAEIYESFPLIGEIVFE